MTPEEWDDRMFCCNGCGTEITDANKVRVVTQKPIGEGDTPQTAGVAELWCCTCAGIPGDLARGD